MIQNVLPTPFQVAIARFLFGLHLLFLCIWVFPQQINMPSWYWATLVGLGIILSFGVKITWTAAVLFIIWIVQLHMTVFRDNPGAFLILYTFFYLAANKPGDARVFIFRMFWVLFVITVIFDLMSAVNTVLDLFPFGMKYEHSYLPPKNWVRLRIAADSFFLFSLLITPLKKYGWMIFFFFHFSWIVGMGYSAFSSTLMITSLFLYNPAWSTVPADTKLKPFIFYDGICVLCNRFTRFLLSEDFARHFYFAPLQGKTAKEKLPRQDQNQVHSIILFEDNKCYYRLDAVIKILTEVGGIWHLARLLWLLPRTWRDKLYMWVANHRYDWFGTLNYCPLPTPEERQYFRD